MARGSARLVASQRWWRRSRPTWRGPSRRVRQADALGARRRRRRPRRAARRRRSRALGAARAPPARRRRSLRSSPARRFAPSPARRRWRGATGPKLERRDQAPEPRLVRRGEAHGTDVRHCASPPRAPASSRSQPMHTIAATGHGRAQIAQRGGHRSARQHPGVRTRSNRVRRGGVAARGRSGWRVDRSQCGTLGRGADRWGPRRSARSSWRHVRGPSPLAAPPGRARRAWRDTAPRRRGRRARPHARLRPTRRSLPSMTRRSECEAQALDQADRVVDRAAGQDDAELLAAVASEDVVGTQRQPPGCRRPRSAADRRPGGRGGR